MAIFIHFSITVMEHCDKALLRAGSSLTVSVTITDFHIQFMILNSRLNPSVHIFF